MEMETDVKTVEEFEEVLRTNRLVICYAWAEWNDYCHRLNRNYKTVANSYVAHAKFISIDVDHLPAYANRVLGIRFMPVVLVIRDGVRCGLLHCEQSDILLRYIRDAIDDKVAK